jgi:hypothetical protein
MMWRAQSRPREEGHFCEVRGHGGVLSSVRGHVVTTDSRTRDAMREFEEGARRAGAAFGMLEEACSHIANAVSILRGAARMPSRRKRPRSLPKPSMPVSELDQARAERVLEQRGFSIEKG